MKTYSFSTLGLVGALLLGGCATPESRIAKSPELFASLSATDQELIKQGKVSVGFSMEMVRLALGDPDRITTRTDANGTSEIWNYVTYETAEGVYLYRGFFHRPGYYHDTFFPYYLRYPDRRERDYFKVAFVDGRVSVIEQERGR